MARQQPTGAEVAPELPERCVPAERPRVETDEQSVTVRWTARCGAEGIVGARFGVLGLAETGTNALLRVALRDGRRVQAVLHAGAPSLVVPERASALGAFRDYLRLGALHIATGFDHLLFVFGLVLLASSTRSSALDGDRVHRGAQRDALARRARHRALSDRADRGRDRRDDSRARARVGARSVPTRESALRRRPWAVAFAFGLLHGFGFAGALAEIGLPQEEIPVALFSFNLGIELGQLAFVALVLALRRALAPALSGAPAWVARAPVTAMGALAVYWCLDRAARLF